MKSRECSFFGAGARFHHVGLAVKSIREASPSSEVEVDDVQRVSMAFLRVGGITLELLEPRGEDSPIERSLREGVRLLHLCYEVPDLDHALERARLQGFHRIRPSARAPVYGDREVAWVFSRHYGLFELIGGLA